MVVSDDGVPRLRSPGRSFWSASYRWRNALRAANPASYYPDQVSLALKGENILRGTTPAVLVGLCGRQLQTSPDKLAATSAAADRVFQNGFVVDKLNIFFSHSWRAPWHEKWLTLLFYFNAVPAIACGLAVAIAGLALVCRTPDQCSRTRFVNHYMVMVAGCLTTAATLLLWQSVVPMRMAPTVFFDKVCIHQADAELKALGIRSIGGIIRCSDTLLVAWDPSYLERLWCPFEIAAFRRAKPLGRVVVLPIQMGFAILMLTFAGFIKALLSWTAVNSLEEQRFTVDGKEDLTRLRVSLHLACFVMYLIVGGVGKSYTRSLEQLKIQVESYSIARAKCFCCDQDHHHPDTKQRLPCDRGPVHSCLAKWYGDGSREEGFKKFDELVRKICGPKLAKEMNGLPYRFVLMATIWQGLSVLVDLWADKNSDRVFVVAFTIDTLFLREPLLISVVFCLTGAFRRLRCLQVPAAALVGVVLHAACIEFYLQLLPSQAQSTGRKKHWMLELFVWLPWMGFEAVAVWWMFHRHRCHGVALAESLEPPHDPGAPARSHGEVELQKAPPVG